MVSDTRNMDDGLVWKPACTCNRCSTKRQNAELPEFFERSKSATLLDRSRYALWEQEPPRNKIPIPGVDDCLDVLI